MATQTYEKTWWGAQWLQALTHIDYDNRLPRGRSYANRGAVTRLEIRGGHIHGQVNGSRACPYQVDVDVPPMPATQAQALVDALSRDPWILSRMLNRELDPAVLDRARALGIAVFHSQWKDLSMRCSCPDWAVPCKHIAAVIYLVSREIDGNPFLVFSLKDVDLIGALQERRIVIAREAQADLPTVDRLCGAGKGPPPPEGGLPAPFAFDYTTLPELGGTLVHVLPSQPVFFPAGDFRVFYGKMLNRIARRARQALESPSAKSLGTWDAEEDPRLEMDAR